MASYSGHQFMRHSEHGWVYKHTNGKWRKFPSNVVTEMDAIKHLDKMYKVGQFNG